MGTPLRSGLLRAFEDETAVNSPATGAPSISGTAQVGETLTADTSGIADNDGLDNAVFGYQWIAGDTEIQGATNADYTLVEADEGKAIKVKVSFTDDVGNPESLTSAATDAVAAATPENNPATGAPSINGTAQVGETLTADTSGISDDDGLTSVSYSHQWLADDADISGATSSTYTLVEADEGLIIQVGVSFTDDAGNYETRTSDGTDAVAPKPNSPATGAPIISGTAQVGETLTADTSGIADKDGLDNVSFSYQWIAGGMDIAGETGAAYTLTEEDEGMAIQVWVTFTDDSGNEETLTSGATPAVAARPNNPATSAPTISGTAQVGETLTAETSVIADEDGLDDVSFSYQWLADGIDISGATGSTYTLTDADQGKTVKVQVSFTDEAGNYETLTSAATDPVAEATQPNNQATGVPTISGTAQVGETLTADTSGISDADGLDNAVFGYQWLAGDSDISGATGRTYTLGDGAEGKAIKVRVSFSDDAGNDETLTSAATDAVAAPEPPAKPTGLSATPSHDRVVLTWDDPQDNSITGYVILRRNRETDAEGEFTNVVPDTGTAAATYTDGTVAAETPYTYRIKAINGHGTSERSRWVHVETTAAPTPEGTPEESVSEGDTDLPNDNSTPGRVVAGGSATGAIGTPGDQDRFAVELEAGRTYRFDLTGSPGGGGTLPDTFFRAIYNSEGDYQPDSYNDDFEGGRDSRVTFTPTESGTYYARVSGDRDEVGSYTLSVQ